MVWSHAEYSAQFCSLYLNIYCHSKENRIQTEQINRLRHCKNGDISEEGNQNDPNPKDWILVLWLSFPDSGSQECSPEPHCIQWGLAHSTFRHCVFDPFFWLLWPIPVFLHFGHGGNRSFVFSWKCCLPADGWPRDLAACCQIELILRLAHQIFYLQLW